MTPARGAHQLALDCQDIETQLKQALDTFNADLAPDVHKLWQRAPRSGSATFHGSRWYEPVRGTSDQPYEHPQPGAAITARA